ncbi:MAG TPA: YXWGXW repeat-containing protein [Steroidobacteraceae bacterium]|nr:YXWGXW repeat-containing protein [Steroidobacteraceae bacterium]
MIKKILLVTVIAASMGGIATPAAADVYVRVEPPALRVEPVPEPRRGYVYAPGYWDWRHGHHVWVKGHWVRERRGYHYVAPEWVDHHDGRWHMRPGRWERGDRDHDGVPNGMDRHPDNPHRD